MPKLIETRTVEVEVEVTPLTDTQLVQLRDWVGDCESLWNDERSWNDLKEKLCCQEGLCLH